MAIRYQDIVKRLQTDPLSNEELVLVQEAEDFIDSEILKKFGDTPYKEVYIDLPVVNFDYSMKTKKPISGIKHPRKELMRKELLKRYNDMGWSFEFIDFRELDSNYVKLKGKK